MGLKVISEESFERLKKKNQDRKKFILGKVEHVEPGNS
jgi:hypothetical protein